MSEYDYDATARELASLVCKARSLQEFKRDKVCIRKALEAAHARGRSEREAELAAEYARGIEDAAKHIELHSCVASCCDAQPSAIEARDLADCVRALARRSDADQPASRAKDSPR